MSLRFFGYFCLTVICAAILGVSSLLAYYTADRRMPVQVLETEVLTPVVHPGGKLVIRQKLRYIRECRGHIDRALYDSKTHRKWLSDIDYERPPQGLGEFVVTFAEDVPTYFEPGEATYRATPVYACNIIHQYIWPMTRNDTVLAFEVQGQPL